MDKIKEKLVILTVKPVEVIPGIEITNGFEPPYNFEPFKRRSRINDKK